MEKYIPDIYQKSIYAIDYQKLIDKGIKCILFDLDNTLVPYSEKRASEKIITLFTNLKQLHFHLILFSNSPRKRLKTFKEELEVDCCANARKPNPKQLYKVLNAYHYSENEVAIIGDQLMTDILVGNRVGITTILINPISKKDPFWTIPNRLREKQVMRRLRSHDLFFQGRYYD